MAHGDKIFTQGSEIEKIRSKVERNLRGKSVIL